MILYYPQYFKYNKNSNREIISNIINNQLAEFEGGISRFSEKEVLKTSLTASIMKNSFDYNKDDPNKQETNWLSFWSRYQSTVSELSGIAICMLSMGISEASCESSFSVQKLNHTAIRNSLKPESIQAEMRIRYNHKKLHSSTSDLSIANLENDHDQSSDCMTDSDSDSVEVELSANIDADESKE